jgi:hypothetical protein
MFLVCRFFLCVIFLLLRFFGIFALRFALSAPLGGRGDIVIFGAVKKGLFKYIIRPRL